MQTAQERRNIVLERLRVSAAQPVLDMEHEIEEKDMTKMYNDWRWDVDSWMLEQNVEKYKELRRRKKSDAQQMAKTSFNSHLFHLSGSRFLLHKLIQLPIIAQCNATSSDSAEQPASLMRCINAMQEHMQSAEYKKAVERSEKKAQGHRRLSKEIWDATWWLAQGKELSMRAQKGEYYDLCDWQQKLVEDYDGGKLERSLKQLLEQRIPNYKGIAASASSAVHPAASSRSAGHPAISNIA